jgi:hypothetical protein
MNRLLKIGFQKVGSWKIVNGNLINELTSSRDAKNILYAFVANQEIKYIGKTTMPLHKRMYGYQKPGPTQTTNIKNNKKIKDSLNLGENIDIFVLIDGNPQYHGKFKINLAAGLEDELIKELNPDWNEQGNSKNTEISNTNNIRLSKTKISKEASSQKYRGKYAALMEYLKLKSDEKTLTLSYKEIEKITGVKLPQSAHMHREWWENGGHVQAEAWLQAGWKRDRVELGQFVTFVKN